MAIIPKPKVAGESAVFDLYAELERYKQRREEAMKGPMVVNLATGEKVGAEFFPVSFSLYGTPVYLIENVKRLVESTEYTLQDTFVVVITHGLDRCVNDNDFRNWMELSKLTRVKEQDFSADEEVWADVVSLTSEVPFTIHDNHMGFKKKYPIKITDHLRSRLNQIGEDAGIKPCKLAVVCMLDAISRVPSVVGASTMRETVDALARKIPKRSNRVVGLLLFSDLQLRPELVSHIKSMGYEERLRRIGFI